jgi:hypothetical protein
VYLAFAAGQTSSGGTPEETLSVKPPYITNESRVLGGEACEATYSYEFEF